MGLRAAVPSFAEHWHDFVSDEAYNPALPMANVFDFVQHLAARASGGQWDEYPALFTALEEAYAHAEQHDLPNVGAFLTIGFLEDLIYAFEQAKLDPQLAQRFLIGPRSKAGWNAAYAYTHPQR